MAKHWKIDGKNTVNKKGLAKWIRDMVKWGKRVRKDIRRLENAGRMAAGDPGDPPPPPE